MIILLDWRDICVTIFGMKRPVFVWIVSLSLISFNLIGIFLHLFGIFVVRDNNIIEHVLVIGSSLFFILVAAAIFACQNWARWIYLIVAPWRLFVNIVLGCLRIGVENLYDRIPSAVVTTVFVIMLLSPSVRTWFAGNKVRCRDFVSNISINILISVLGFLFLLVEFGIWQFIYLLCPGTNH